MVTVKTTAPVVTFVDTLTFDRHPQNPITFGTGTDFNDSMGFDVVNDGFGNPLVTMSGFASSELVNASNFFANIRMDKIEATLNTISGTLQSEIDDLRNQLVALSGTCCSGTVSGTEPPVSGTGQMVSIDFDGVDEVLRSADDLDIGISNTWSISLWAKTNMPDGNIFYAKPVVGDADAVSFFVGFEGRITVKLHNSSGVTFKHYRFENLLKDDLWSFVVFTWDGTDLKAYTQGSEILPGFIFTDDADSMGNSSRKVAIGGPPEFSGNFEGFIYSCAVWNEVLTASGITELYNSGLGAEVDYSVDGTNYTSSSNLLHWWRLGLDPNDIGKDYGNHTTLIDVMDDAVGIDATDIVNDYPGM